MKVAFVLYPGMTALDVVGPYEVISRWPDVDVRFLATTREPIRADRGLVLSATETPDTLPQADVILVGGAEDPLGVLEDHALVDWLRAAAPHARWTASVCTGAVVYAAAGLLEGRRATTHWGFRDNLRAMGVDVVTDRVVWDGDHISGAGVSAGIDMALALTAHVHGEKLAKALQLGIEYDPQPPFAEGSPDTASASTLRLALRILLGDRPVHSAARYTRHLVGEAAGRLAARTRS